MTKLCKDCKYFYEKNTKKGNYICNEPNQINRNWSFDDMWNCVYELDMTACSNFTKRRTNSIPKITFIECIKKQGGKK